MKRLLVCVRNGQIGCWQKGKAHYCENCKGMVCPPKKSKIIYCYKEERNEADNLQCLSGFA